MAKGAGKTKKLAEVHDYTALKRVGFFLGPLLFALVLAMPAPETLSHEAWRVLAVMAWMVTWWIVESVPLYATALLPLVLFPTMGVFSFKHAAVPYASPVIFLFLGGFVLTLAMERWNLHRRFALAVVRLMGASANNIVLGCMLATALVSMWISNTATVVMMLPIGMSIVQVLMAHDEIKDKPGKEHFAAAMMLGLAYASSIGGVGTLVGTPTNAVFKGYLLENYDIEIDFLDWMKVGIPAVLLMLVATWLLLVEVFFRNHLGRIPDVDKTIATERKKLGKMTFGEKAVAAIFVLAALLWTFSPQIEDWTGGAIDLDEAGVAIIVAVLIFITPVNFAKGEFLLDWSETKRLPWGILILFGGGLSLAGAVSYTGLAEWCGNQLSGFSGVSPWVIVALGCLFVVFLSEVMSNVATITVFLPIISAISVGFGINPLLLGIPATLAASYAFMLPVGTPPNAIVYSTGYIKSAEMAKVGFVLNFVAVAILLAVTYFVVVPVFGVDLGALPDWAVEPSGQSPADMY